jgi:hypothetical protein
MFEQIYTYFTIEILYFWVNLGVLPFWLILIFIPQSNICRIFTTSVFPILLLSGAYVFMLYLIIQNNYDFLANFSLYIGVDSLATLFSENSFLMMFWIHFVSINLFVGGWIVKNSQQLNINKILLSLPLILTYLIGPLGISIYWIIKICYTKKISLYD